VPPPILDTPDHPNVHPAPGGTLWRLAGPIAVMITIAASAWCVHYAYEQQVANHRAARALAAVAERLRAARLKLNQQLRESNDWQARLGLGHELQLILHAPDFQRILLEPPAGRARGKAGAAGFVATSRQLNRAVLAITGLPRAPRGQVYELWWVSAHRRSRPALRFYPAAQGWILVPAIPPPDEPALGVELTLEPDGGSPQPSGPVLMAGHPAALTAR